MKKNQIAIFKSEDGQLSFNVNVFDETVWLTQKQISILFDKADSTIKEHIKNVYDDKECLKIPTSRKFRLVQIEGDREIAREVDHYNLDVIISVGYRVKSQRGVQFRQWASSILKEYLLNGYAVNEARIRKIEESIDDLVAANKILKKDVRRIENLLVKLIEKPIVIHNNNVNNNNIGVGFELEERLIAIIDEIISNLADKKDQNKIHIIKKEILKPNKDEKTKNKIINFVKDLGDENSDIGKLVKGAGVSKKIIKELIKIANKLKYFV